MGEKTGPGAALARGPVLLSQAYGTGSLGTGVFAPNHLA